MANDDSISEAGVDVGGTNIEVGLVADGHSVLARSKRPPPTGGPGDVLDVIEQVAGCTREPVVEREGGDHGAGLVIVEERDP